MNAAAPGRAPSLFRAIAAGGLCALSLTHAAFGQEDPIDRLDDRLTFGAWSDNVRLRLSGTLDLEDYYLQGPATGLIYPDGGDLFTPRLSLFLDAQFGARIYAFAQARADDGFDPGEGGAKERLDEYALRYSPWDDGRLNLQVGKFATMVGNWTPRHGSWEDPFITAPLPYENLTGIWDTTAVRSTGALLAWAGVRPRPDHGGEFLQESRDVPVIWGPSYASGAAVFGQLGSFDYSLEVKNTSLSSRPDSWAPTEAQWEHPTYSGRVSYLPDEMWNIGFSASAGTYLQPGAAPTLAPGRGFEQYLEIVLGQDVGFAWHHVEIWTEVYEARFELPGVGNADTQAYYVEAKYKFTPQFFGALRWNQEIFADMNEAAGLSVPWGRNVERIDMGPGYRFTPHLQAKIQYSLEHQEADVREWGQMTAVQLTARF